MFGLSVAGSRLIYMSGDTAPVNFKNSLRTHAIPVHIAYHIVEILSGAGYDDELIEDISTALTDSVARY